VINLTSPVDFGFSSIFGFSSCEPSTLAGF